MVRMMMMLMHVHGPQANRLRQEKFPEFGILLNYHCRIHSKYSHVTTVLALTIVQAPPRDSLSLRIMSRGLPTGVPQFVLRRFVPYLSSVLVPVPASVPVLKPTQALVIIAAKNVLQESGPR